MAKPKLEPTNLGSIARGALLELFNANMVKVAQNIADTSTDPEAPREITLKLKFKPDPDRRGAKLTTECTAKLAAIAKHQSRVYVNKGTDNVARLFDDDPRQDILFEPPEQAELVDFKSIAAGPQ